MATVIDTFVAPFDWSLYFVDGDTDMKPGIVAEADAFLASIGVGIEDIIGYGSKPLQPVAEAPVLFYDEEWAERGFNVVTVYAYNGDADAYWDAQAARQEIREGCA